MGCVDEHGPPDSKEPDVGYATWSLWFGLSKSLPFQQLVFISIGGGGYVADLRGKCDGGPNATSAYRSWQMQRICAYAWRATRRVLLHVAEVAMVELLLLAFLYDVQGLQRACGSPISKRQPGIDT
jgi:hypothetical protein